MSQQQPAQSIGSGPTLVAILDDYPLLSPTYINSLPTDILSQLTVHIYTSTLAPSSPELVRRLEPYKVIITMRERTPFPSALIDQLPNLKYLMTTGLRNLGLDVPALLAKGVTVTGTPAPRPAEGGISATAQHTWALILALTNNVPREDHQTRREGQWLSATPLNITLAGKTLGLLGLGKLGAETAKIGHAFGLNIIAWSENLNQDKADEAAAKYGFAKGTFRAVSKQELFRTSDILSVHVVLGERTRGLVGPDELLQMGRSSIIVNTSRGPIIQEQVLLEVLEQGLIRGAALDVFDVEPLPLDSPWRTTRWGEDGRSQVVITPHSGYSFAETLRTMWTYTAANLERYVKGEDVLDKLQ